MRTILHIKSATADALAETVIATQVADETLRAVVVNLNVDEPDYQSALEQIFTADSVAVW